MQVTSGQTVFIIPDVVTSDFLVTLNGLVLYRNLDFSYSAQVVTLFEECVSDDILTLIYTTSSNNGFIGDNLEITAPIVSGITDEQGSNSVYFNTTTGKYEIYTSITPKDGNDILVMLNGVTLANGIDFNRSSTNNKRIILEGDIIISDIITMVYYPISGVANGLNTNYPLITWIVNNPPQAENGYFSLEVSTGETFSNFYYSGNTKYDIGLSHYSDSFVASGEIGTKLYYRVKNNKNYETICGDIVNSIAYSEVMPVTIQTNSINTY